MKKPDLITGMLLLFCFTSFAQVKTNPSLTLHKTVPDSMKFFSYPMLPLNYYFSNLGFFCKKELQVQQAIKFPLRFRLGSVAYCDAMEGKNNAHP